MTDGSDYTPTREQIIGAACSWFAEYGIDGVDLSDADIEAMVERGLAKRRPRVCTCWWNRAQHGHEKRCDLYTKPNMNPSEDTSLDGLTEGQLADEIATWDY